MTFLGFFDFSGYWASHIFVYLSQFYSLFSSIYLVFMWSYYKPVYYIFITTKNIIISGYFTSCSMCPMSYLFNSSLSSFPLWWKIILVKRIFYSLNLFNELVCSFTDQRFYSVFYLYSFLLLIFFWLLLLCLLMLLLSPWVKWIVNSLSVFVF